MTRLRAVALALAVAVAPALTGAPWGGDAYAVAP